MTPQPTSSGSLSAFIALANDGAPLRATETRGGGQSSAYVRVPVAPEFLQAIQPTTDEVVPMCIDNLTAAKELPQATTSIIHIPPHHSSVTCPSSNNMHWTDAEAKALASLYLVPRIFPAQTPATLSRTRRLRTSSGSSR